MLRFMWISLCASDPLMMGCVPSHKSDMNDRVLVGPFNPSRVFGVALVRLFYGSGIKRPYASALPAIAKASGNESDLKQIPDSEISKVNCKNQGMDGANVCRTQQGHISAQLFGSSFRFCNLECRCISVLDRRKPEHSQRACSYKGPVHFFSLTSGSLSELCSLRA